ncbi:MAG TPA: hypothetical protein PKA98_22875 [Acidimicrobiales bacterium]|nr:hypothetical protein [Acidimicrobiales bacterium]
MPVIELELDPGPGVGDLVLRVFLDRPDATAETPATDPGYVGSFSLFAPDAAAGAQRVRLPLGSATAQALATVTLIAVPIRPDVTSGAVTVRSATILR